MAPDRLQPRCRASREGSMTVQISQRGKQYLETAQTMTSFDVTIPASLKAALDAEIKRTKGTVSSVVTAGLSQYLGVPVHTVFQVSISGALVAGVYDKEVSVKSILQHGDFGLGTFANLDGEMIVLDGKVYQVQGT